MGQNSRRIKNQQKTMQNLLWNRGEGTKVGDMSYLSAEPVFQNKGLAKVILQAGLSAFAFWFILVLIYA